MDHLPAHQDLFVIDVPLSPSALAVIARAAVSRGHVFDIDLARRRGVVMVMGDPDRLFELRR
jgi:hypothetical protein